jgi:hypothetical protein
MYTSDMANYIVVHASDIVIVYDRTRGNTHKAAVQNP